MCKDCGCGQVGTHGRSHDHEHPHRHNHEHPQPHAHDHEHPHSHPHTLTVEQRILAQNESVAEANRAWFDAHGIVALNLISSPGTGKTALLEKTLDALRGNLPAAVITGDPQTDNDARRLRGRGAVVWQIETHGACHLDAARIRDLLPEVESSGAKLLFIENVGNLVCPAAFDLGEHFKVALLSTTEGEDKPLKYPALFAQAPVVVLTKMDLAPHLDWDLTKARAALNRVRPGVFIFELSARTGAGMDAWLEYLRRLR